MLSGGIVETVTGEGAAVHVTGGIGVAVAITEEGGV